MNEKLKQVRKQLELLEDSIIFNGLYRISSNVNISNYKAKLYSNIKANNLSYHNSSKFLNSIDPDYVNTRAKEIKSRIIDAYIEFITLNSIEDCASDSDIDYIIMIDDYIISTIYKRICLGMDVAQSKFDYNPTEYKRLILNKNREALMTLLTDLKKEDEVIERVENKATHYIKNIQSKIQSKIFSDFYRNFIIPLTKDMEIDFLFSIIIND